MNRNESNAALRTSGPAPVFDPDGELLAGQLFRTATGEMLVSLDGAVPVAAATDGIEVGLGLYRYPFSQPETNVNVFTTAIFRQKARLNLATKTTNCTTRIRAKSAGEGGNALTIAFVQSGAVTPTTGTLVRTGNDIVFTFKDAVTTVANFEALVAASADIEIDVVGATHVLATADAFTATNLAGGLRDASYTQMITQTPTTSAQAAAVWNYLIEGSHTAQDFMKGFMSILAGIAQGFISGIIEFKSMNGATIRIRVTLGPDGRPLVEYLDLVS